MSDEVELRAAWDSVVPPTHRSREVFDDVVARHRQPHRRYHGVRHVVWMLRHVRELEAAIAACHVAGSYDGAAVIAAAFFHDAIYDAARSDNEERSALLAEHQLATLAWAPARISVVGALVRATASHVAEPPGSPDAAADGDFVLAASTEREVLLDADLAVLGSEPAAYGAYATGVRAEYSHVPDGGWRIGRAAVIQRLLDRPSIYVSAPAQAWWESRARANLAAELAMLGPAS